MKYPIAFFIFLSFLATIGFFFIKKDLSTAVICLCICIVLRIVFGKISKKEEEAKEDHE